MTGAARDRATGGEAEPFDKAEEEVDTTRDRVGIAVVDDGGNDRMTVAVATNELGGPGGIGEGVIFREDYSGGGSGFDASGPTDGVIGQVLEDDQAPTGETIHFSGIDASGRSGTADKDEFDVGNCSLGGEMTNGFADGIEFANATQDSRKGRGICHGFQGAIS